MSKILVVYYSRTGHTRAVAQQLANKLGADLESIEDADKGARGAGFWSYSKCALEAAFHLKAPIRKPRHDVSQYDLVLIGTPIWCWSVSSPVRSYIAQHGRAFPRLAFFCTCGGAGQNKVLKELEHLTGHVSVANCAIREAEVADKQYIGMVDDFVARLKKSGGIESPLPRAGAAMQGVGP